MVCTAAYARESLGVFSQWGAFRDPDAPRCYAIAKAAPSTLQRDFDPYISIATWPSKQVRNQVYFRLSRKTASSRAITLALNGKRFALTGSGGNAWARDQAMDAAITSAMRSAKSMVIHARDRSGRNFSNTYSLRGAATAMDAATIGCARRAS